MSVPTFFMFAGGRDWKPKSVEVAGSFNNWTKVKMKKRWSEWTLTLELPPGQHQYKFYVDNKWTNKKDKYKPPTTQDNFGGLNNIITVEERGDLKVALKDALEADYEKLKKIGRLDWLVNVEELPFDVSYELLASKIENDINGTFSPGLCYSRSLLGVSVSYGWEEVCKLLISAGACLNSDEHTDDALLNIASEYGWENICEILLSTGAYTNILNGWNPEEEDSEAIKPQISRIFEKYWKKESSLPHRKRKSSSPPENPDQAPEDHQILSAPWNRFSVPAHFVFTSEPNGACARVEVAGSFNNWIKVKMCNDDGEWTLTLKLPPGQYQYKFFVDNKWIHNKENPTIEDNEGGLNNVITVEEKGDLKLKGALKDALQADYENLKKMGMLDKLVYREELPFDFAYELLASKIENDINGPLKEGCRCLLGSAAAFGWEEVCKLLISQGADVNMKETRENTGEDSKETPLYCAAKYGWPNICKILLSAGAFINIKDPWNWSEHDASKYDVLDIAKKENHTQVIDVLEEHISSLPPWSLDQVLEDYGISLPEINKEIEIYSKVVGEDTRVDTRSKCTKGHPLLSRSKSPYRGEGRCDICRRDITFEVDDPGWHCQECKYDVCKRCHAIVDWNGITALSYYASIGKKDACNALIEGGADVNKINVDGSIALFMAIRQSAGSDICKMLIEAGADVNKMNADGPTALFMAIRQSAGSDICKMLIEAGADVNKMNADGSTALFMAISQSAQNDICKMLIEAGADVDKENMLHGETPLLKAIKKIPESGYIEIAKMLLSAGADAVRKRDYNGKTGLFYAVSEGHTEIVKAILEKEIDLSGAPCQAEDGWTPIMEAIQKGHTEICKLLIDGGAALDKHNDDGETALMIAVKEEKPEFCKILISAGADICKRDQDHYGKTALDIAKANDPSTLSKNNLDVIDVFEKHGVPVKPLQLNQVLKREGVYEENIDELYGDGITALLFSIQIGNENDCKFLIESGADINWTNGIIMKPLALAVSYGRENICKMLIEAGADVNSRDGKGERHMDTKLIYRMWLDDLKKPHGKGNTPLIHAILHNRQNICKMLIESGADVELTDGKGNLPLWEALCLYRENIFKMLMEAGANTETSNFDMREALYKIKNDNKYSWGIVKTIMETRPDIDFGDFDNFLTKATAYEQAEMCKLLMEAGADPLENDGKPLINAAQNGLTDIVKMFLEKITNINVDNYKQKTPLMATTEERHAKICKSLADSLRAAIKNRHTEICELLIKAGAVALKKSNEERLAEISKLLEDSHEPNEEIYAEYCKLLEDSHDDYTPLMAATEERHAEIVKLLIEAGADPLEKNDGYYYFEKTPLIYAAQNGLTDIVKMFLEKITNMNVDNYNQKTPLMATSEERHAEICKLLEDSLGVAIKNGHTEICELLIEAGAVALKKPSEERHAEICIKKQLKDAAKDGRIDIVKMIIEERPDVDVDDFLDTLLMSATRNEHVEMCKLLIEAGANPLEVNEYHGWEDFQKFDIKKHGIIFRKYNYNGYSPLRYAARSGRADIVKMFLEKLLNMNVDNYKQKTALMAAAEDRHAEICKQLVYSLNVAINNRHTEVIKLLIEAGALAGDLRKALYHATRKGLTDIVKIIIEKALNLDVNDYDDYTPLMAATEEKHAEIVKLLIEAGADPLEKNDGYDYFEKTPLIYASQNGLTDIVKMFLEKITNMNVDNYKQKTPLMATSEERHAEICKSLEDSLRVAIKNGHTEICQLPIEAGAVALKKPNEERHAEICKLLEDSLRVAIENRHTEICELLIEAGAVTFKKPNDEKVRDVLFHAAKKGLTNIVKMIIEKAPNLDVNDYDDRKTLLIAAVDNVEIFKLLIEAGADMNKQNHNGNTPLISAIRYSTYEIKEEICKLLVEAGADLDKQNACGYTALCMAAEDGYAEICDILLTAGADANIMCDCADMHDVYNHDKKFTACDIATYYDYDEAVGVFKKHGEASNIDIKKQFISAAKDGHIDIVKMIIEKRPDVDVHDFLSPPLLHATRNGHMEMCKLLIEAGADPFKDEYGDGGYSPLLYAVRGSRADIVKMFLKKLPNMNVDNYKQETPLMAAAEDRHAEIYKKLVYSLEVSIDNWSKFNDRDTEVSKLLIEAGAFAGDLQKALYEAACNGLTDTVKIIIEKALNIDVNHVYDVNDVNDYKYRTPLMAASNAGHDEIVKLLVEAGADIDDYDDNTPLMAASNEGHTEVVKLLAKAGANLDKQDERGYTALMLAAKRYEETVKVLVEAGADLDKQNKFGETALMEATDSLHRSRLDTCMLLTKAGADLDKQNKKGQTALMLAAKRSSLTLAEDVIDILLTAGADANITCVDNECFKNIYKNLYNPDQKITACDIATCFSRLAVKIFKKHGVYATIKPMDLYEID